MTEKSHIMDESAVKRTLVRMAHEIVEKNAGCDTLCLLGIQRRGVPLAQRLAENIRSFSDITVEVGSLDITLYRDDLDGMNVDPIVNSTKIDFSVKDRTVVLVDDVIYTGRTIRAALEAVIKKERPQRIQLAVLIDRGHRELPIRGDFVGKNLPTSRKEVVAVYVPEIDGDMGVAIFDKTE
ncbi:MAG: bifunctional pyr operon transcriptional regulator/uracil phosphoribosyltransferase PyrR [Clostridia bacterium]|nr:bifunctional pyr operon transcriptional regulator/uracil phosphoribosyltransferase PyrR [Clostridia bacterium]